MNNIWKDFTEYIIRNYSNSKKIVEVGVGKVFEPSQIIKNNLKNTDITLVDLYPANDNVAYDDITNPTDTIYNDVDLIYCIRPPEELQKNVLELGLKYNCDVIIKPLSSEEIQVNLQRLLKLKNYGKTMFYIYNKE